MFRLDYISCVLTISAAILLGQKRWQGWLVAGINSIVVCDIALNTSQLGFIPANVFCVALYAWNILGWRRQIKAGRELHRIPVDPRAMPVQAAPLPPRRHPLPLAQVRFETFCCERVVSSLEPSSPPLLDLHNLLSCAINPRPNPTRPNPNR